MSSALQLIAIGAMVIALLAGHALAVPYPQVGGTPTRHSRPVTISAFVPSDWETLPLPQTRYVHGSLGGNATTIYATGLVTLSAPAITTTVAGPAFTDTYTFPGTTVTQNQTDIIVLSGSSVQEIHIDPSSAKCASFCDTPNLQVAGLTNFWLVVAYCGVEADGTELSCEQVGCCSIMIGRLLT